MMLLCRFISLAIVLTTSISKTSAFAPFFPSSSTPRSRHISSSSSSAPSSARSSSSSILARTITSTISTTISTHSTTKSSFTSSSSHIAMSSSSSAAETTEQPTDKTSSSMLKLNPAAETACVFIEYQNEFTTQGGALYDAVKDCMEATGTLENSRKVLDAARGAGCTIIHVPIAFEKGHNEIAKKPYGILAGIKEGELFKAGSWSTEICDIMKPTESDLICKGKNGLCGFSSTNLDFLLRQNGVKNVVLAGFLTNCCVESTMRSAYELGYQVYTLKDCCAATSVAAQDATFEHNFGMFSVPTTSTEIIGALGN